MSFKLNKRSESDIRSYYAGARLTAKIFDAVENGWDINAYLEFLKKMEDATIRQARESADSEKIIAKITEDRADMRAERAEQRREADDQTPD